MKVSLIFQSFHKMITTQFGAPIRRMRSDNEKENFSQNLASFSKTEELFMNPLVLLLSNKMGVESKSRHILNFTRALLFQINVQNTFRGGSPSLSLLDKPHSPKP